MNEKTFFISKYSLKKIGAITFHPEPFLFIGIYGKRSSNRCSFIFYLPQYQKWVQKKTADTKNPRTECEGWDSNPRTPTRLGPQPSAFDLAWLPSLLCHYKEVVYLIKSYAR